MSKRIQSQYVCPVTGVTVTVCKPQRVVHSKMAVPSAVTRTHRGERPSEQTIGWKPVYTGEVIKRKGGK